MGGRCSCGTTLTASEVLHLLLLFPLPLLIIDFQQAGQLAATWDAWSASSSGRAALVDSSGSDL